MLSSPSQVKKKKRKTKRKEKKTLEKKKCKERREITFFLLHLGWNTPFAFASSHSFNVELSTFLKPCVSCLLEALCYSSSGALPSSEDGVGRKWGEGGRRGKFWGKEGGWKIPGQGKRMCFVHPQNSLNGLILNWCTDGCWFTPALPEWGGN